MEGFNSLLIAHHLHCVRLASRASASAAPFVVGGKVNVLDRGALAPAWRLFFISVVDSAQLRLTESC